MPFRDILGHRHLVTLLARAVANDTLPPALLFSGPPGVGKRRTALAVAQAMNCPEPRETEGLARDACGTCPACRRIERLVHPDVLLVEPGDSGSIKVEQVREVVDQAGYRPFEGRKRVVVIDEADALVPAAQNALLKTLEEPPSASVFLLVSSMADALLATVRSRCPRLRFGPLTSDEVAALLVRDHEWTEADARVVAADAGGSIGQALASASADIADARASAARLLDEAGRTRDPGRRLESAKELGGKKSDLGGEREQLAACLRAMGSLLRDAGVLSGGADANLLTNADMADEVRRLAAMYTGQRGVDAFGAVDRARAALERNASPKIVADWLVLQL